MAETLDHPDHGRIVADRLDTRVHDDEATWYCERCHHHVPRDEAERFDDIDCDDYKELTDRLTGSINDTATETTQ